MGKAPCALWSTTRLDSMVGRLAAIDFAAGARHQLDIGIRIVNLWKIWKNLFNFV